MDRQRFISVLALVLCSTGSSKVIPLSKRVCELIVEGYDCSGQDLQSIPDELPSSTKILDFSFNYLPAIHNSTFVRLEQLVSLDLTRCKINWIYEDALSSQKHLESLVLTGNPLLFVSDDAFAGPQSLKHLSLDQASMGDIEFIPYTYLDSLETLDLSNNDIQFLHGLNQFNWQKLTSLNLQMNSLQRILTAEVAVFKNTSGLDISFKGNSILYIEPKAFESCHLNSLDFSDCLSEGDVTAILAGLGGVQTNILSLGVYEESPPATIRAQSLYAFCDIRVNELSFQLQHFPDIADAPFECLTGLQKLDLTRAHLNFLPATIGKMASLSKLILNENKFMDLCHTNAASLPSLTILSVRGNREWMSLNVSCLRGLSKLDQLDLSHNRMNTGAQCCEIQLAGLGQLHNLNLSHSSPMKWGDLPFNETAELLLLDCSNLIVTYDHEHATGGPLRNLHKLRTLHISWKFAGQGNILQGLQTLQHLNLRGSSFEQGMISNSNIFIHVPLLESLVLSECSIVSIEDGAFLPLTKLMYTDLSGNRLVVVNTNAFHSLNNILLNFARNYVEIVEVDSVKGLGKNSQIDISDNPLACNCSNNQFIVWIQGNANKVMNIDRTRCGGSKDRLLDVHLNCLISSGILAFGLVVLLIAIPAIVFFIIRKLRRNYSRYQQV